MSMPEHQAPTTARADDVCPHCRNARCWGCKFGCPAKQPPSGPSAIPYEKWSAMQKAFHAQYHEKCGHSWRKHVCPDEPPDTNMRWY